MEPTTPTMTDGMGNNCNGEAIDGTISAPDGTNPSLDTINKMGSTASTGVAAELVYDNLDTVPNLPKFLTTQLAINSQFVNFNKEKIEKTDTTQRAKFCSMILLCQRRMQTNTRMQPLLVLVSLMTPYRSLRLNLIWPYRRSR